MQTSVLKSAAWGVAGGIVITLIVGFWFAGWYTAGSAQKLAADTADKAVVDALAPVCAADFQTAASSQQKAALAKAATYDRPDLIKKVVATLPGQKEITAPLANACGDAIEKLAAASAAK
jgi:hypothetical protein